MGAPGSAGISVGAGFGVASRLNSPPRASGIMSDSHFPAYRSVNTSETQPEAVYTESERWGPPCRRRYMARGTHLRSRARGQECPCHTGLRPRLGNLRHGRFAAALGLWRGEMIRGQSFFQELETFLRRIGHLEKFEVARSDGAGVNHRFEIEDLFPVRGAVNDHDYLLGQLLRLGESEDLKKLVERAKTAGKNHQPLGQVREPEFAHEKIMKLEVERRRDVRVRILLKGQIDIEADGLSSR